jgi:hypothetical protein
MLDDMVTLHMNPEPDAILRVWLFFEGHGGFRPLPEPQIPEFHREMTTVIEWGGVLLN